VGPDTDAEAILDAEWSSAAAPNAAIVMASCKDTGTTGVTFGGLIALQNLINAATQPPAIMSLSYGQCETVNGAAANAAYSSIYQQAVAEGVSVFVAAGDSGAAGCDNSVAQATHGIGVNAFASTPYNVAVGGTDFSDTYSGTNSTYWESTNSSTYGSALSYVPEIPWNDSCAGKLLSTYEGYSSTYGSSSLCNDSLLGLLLQSTVGGGGGPSGCATGAPSESGVVGGTCQGWPKPTWQSVFGNPSDGVRDTPDVSLFAADGLWSHYYIFCWSDTAHGGAACTGAPSGWSGAGGTSFAAPIMAGIQALVNQKTGSRQGNPNPVYYQLASTEYGTSGSSACNSSEGNGVAGDCVFYDVTLGDMDVDCYFDAGNLYNCYDPGATTSNGIVGVLSSSNTAYQPAFSAAVGWDFATGIGTLNAANLVNNWPSSAPDFTLTALPPTQSVNPGGSAQYTVSVSPLHGYNSNVTLSVSGLPANTTGNFDMNPIVGGSGSSTLMAATNTNTPQGTFSLTITGTDGTLTHQAFVTLSVVQPGATLSPTSLSFSTQVIGTTSSARVVTLSSSGTAALNITSIATSGDFAQTNNCPATLNVGAKCAIGVTFTPSLLGAESATLDVNDNAANSPQTVALSGAGIAPVTLTPNSANFGNVPQATASAAKNFTLKNNQSVALSISGITFTGANAGDFSETNTCGTSLAAKGACTINVTFTPSLIGAESATLTVNDNAPAPYNALSSSLTGTGVAQAAVSPTSLTFAAQKVGTTSAAKTVTLTNNLSAPITFSGASFSGSEAGDFNSPSNTCGGSVAAKSHCTISVTFTPGATGTRTATLNVNDSANNSPQTVSLTGTGK
jgi:subtilase family serine protease